MLLHEPQDDRKDDPLMQTLVTAVGALRLPDPSPKPTTLSPGQLEATQALWEAAAQGISVGVWECGPGTFSAHRDDHHEICVITAGSGILRPQEGEARTIGAGDLVVLPEAGTGPGRFTSRSGRSM